MRYSVKGQAMAPETIRFGKEAFDKSEKTTIRWLSNAGLFINSRGTCLMVDPLLEGYDLPLLIEAPIKPDEVPYLDAILITHSDNDHFSIKNCKVLSGVCREYHATPYVSGLMQDENLHSFGHSINESFTLNDIKITLTPADHAWQNETPSFDRHFATEDFCGFWIETADGTIWAPGDTRLMPAHLSMVEPDVILFDFSDNSWHIGFDNAVKLANNYPNSHLILSHWGTVDAPDMDPFNADPVQLIKQVVNPERIHVLAAGEPFYLHV